MWDDANNVWEGGGSCITQQEAAQKLLEDPSGLEQISIALSNDGNLASFTGVSAVPTDIRWAGARGMSTKRAYYLYTLASQSRVPATHVA